MIDAMQERLDRAPNAMRIRRATVEHPFGTLKAWMGATHFKTRTLEKVRTEMSLHVLAYNLKRVIAILGAGPLMAGDAGLRRHPKSSRHSTGPQRSDDQKPPPARPCADHQQRFCTASTQSGLSRSVGTPLGRPREPSVVRSRAKASSGHSGKFVYDPDVPR